MNGTCGICNKPADCRPYGAGGSLICFPCMKASPACEREARRQLGARLDAAGPDAILVDGHVIKARRGKS